MEGSESWGLEGWGSWQTWAWYRQSCRTVSAFVTVISKAASNLTANTLSVQYTSQLKTYVNILEGVSLSKLDSAEGVYATTNAAAIYSEKRVGPGFESGEFQRGSGDCGRCLLYPVDVMKRQIARHSNLSQWLSSLETRPRDVEKGHPTRRKHVLVRFENRYASFNCMIHSNTTRKGCREDEEEGDR